jgi:hypothetical protein
VSGETVDELKKALPDMKYLNPVLMKAPTFLHMMFGEV